MLFSRAITLNLKWLKHMTDCSLFWLKKIIPRGLLKIIRFKNAFCVWHLVIETSLVILTFFFKVQEIFSWRYEYEHFTNFRPYFIKFWSVKLRASYIYLILKLFFSSQCLSRISMNPSKMRIKFTPKKCKMGIEYGADVAH